MNYADPILTTTLLDMLSDDYVSSLMRKPSEVEKSLLFLLFLCTAETKVAMSSAASKAKENAIGIFWLANRVLFI